MEILKFENTVPEKYNRTIEQMLNYIVINGQKKYYVNDNNFQFLYSEIEKKFRFDADEVYNGILLCQYLCLFGENSELYFRKDKDMIKSFFEENFRKELMKYTTDFDNKPILELDLNDYLKIVNIKSKFI